MASKELNEEFRNDLYTPSFPLDLAIDWVNDRMSPGEVFSKEKLVKWALENGYTQKRG